MTGLDNDNFAQIYRKQALAAFKSGGFIRRMQIWKFAMSSLLTLASMGSASAVVGFTETFNTNDGNWFAGSSSTPTHFTTGGIDDSGYISYTSSFTSAATGPFGSPPSAILLRANDSNNASGDAFVGNWLEDDVTAFSIAVRHNYTSDLNFYARFAAGPPAPLGSAASLASDVQFTIAPNTWTTVSIPIVDGNPPFLSYGPGTFNSVFSAVQNLQFGFYFPASTTFTNFRMDIDNATVTVVPEPTSVFLVGLGLGIFACHRRRR